MLAVCILISMFAVLATFGFTVVIPSPQERKEKEIIVSLMAVGITSILTAIALMVSISWAAVFFGLCFSSFFWFFWFGASGEFGTDDGGGGWGGGPGPGDDDSGPQGDDPGPGGLGRDLDWSEFDAERENWDTRVSA